MATKTPTTNLLDKFSKLFNKPGEVDADTGQLPSDSPRIPSLGRTQKDKRREDSVRSNELNHLRSLIQVGTRQDGRRAMASAGQPAKPGHSRPAALARDSLLDKIDGAQAHVEQWWGTGSAPLTPHTSPAEGTDPGDDDLELDFTGLLALQEDAPTTVAPDSAGAPLLDEQPTLAPPLVEASMPSVGHHDDETQLSALERCLRDAAVHYAEGEFDVAHHLLTTLMEAPDTGPQAAEALAFALFDIYRCNDQREQFDAWALEYARRFGRSPGEWIPIGADAPATGASMAVAGLDAQRERQTFWRCPAILDAAAWTACMAHHPTDSQVFSINWLPLQHIDAAVAPVLATQFTEWSNSPVELHWVGVDTLLQALRMGCLGADAASKAPWWSLQFELLCMAQRTEAFEEVALDYCVASEMSPPSWKAAACKLVQADEIAPTPDFVATLPLDPADVPMPAPVPLPYAVFLLQGNMTGRHPAQLAAMAAAARTVPEIEIQCARLGRIDIEASYVLREWLQECRSRGCDVRFTQLPRLVWVYMRTLGLHGLADLGSGRN